MDNQNACGVCGTHQEISLTLNNRDRTYDLACKPTAEFENELRAALLCYWRWCAEGQPQYGARDPGKRTRRQYYYDPYHNAITYDSATDTYRYDIQIADRPEGDTWVRGTFKVVGRCDIDNHRNSGSATI